MAVSSSRYHMATLKIVLVGEAAVGKTSLLICFHQSTFPGLYVPTVFDSYWKEVSVDGNEYGLLLWDNSGNDDYIRLRPLSYPQTDVFLVCFDISNRESFVKLQETWLPEVKRYQNGTPIIIVGNKMDARSESQQDDDTASNDVLHVEGVRLALREGAIYCECSAKENRGVREVFETAVRYYNHHQPSLNNVGCCCGFTRNRTPNIPFLPPPCPLPVVNLQPSTFSEDIAKLLVMPNSRSDVTFLLSNGTKFTAHRLVLCCTSSLFRRIFLSNTGLSSIQSIDSIKHGGKLTSKDINNKRVKGITSVSNDQDRPYDCVYFSESQQICFTLSDDVKQEPMSDLLTFLYNGKVDLTDDMCSGKRVTALLKLAQIFKVETLVDILKTEFISSDYMNTDYVNTQECLSEEWNDQFISYITDLFLNIPRFTDMIFVVDGKKVHAHQSILIARCDVIAAMLSGNFQESEKSQIPLPSVPYGGFMGFLQYLYTDEVNFDLYDAIEVLKVANQFCLPRLITLCEVFLEKIMEATLLNSKKKSDRASEIVNLILTAQTHNALQLVSKYLFYIAINFEDFRKKKELQCLSTDNLTLIEQQRWPPPCYLTELQAYRRTHNRTTCNIL